MQFRNMLALTVITVAAATLTPASAATIATATVPLNIHSGPGPHYSVISAIPGGYQATIIGCVQGSMWCQVNYNGRQGWAYAQYLTVRLSGRSLIAAKALDDIPTVAYQAPVQSPVGTVGSAVPTQEITGTLIERPANERPVIIAPPPTVRSYVFNHPIAPVYVNSDMAEGVELPNDVEVAPVPGYDYEYAYVNNVPVLVEPQTRQVEYIYR
jgi:uncharacterized protein YraI